MTRARCEGLARREQSEAPRKPGTLGLALRAGAVGAVVMGTWGWYAAHTPGSSAPAPAPPSPAQAAAATPAPAAPLRPRPEPTPTFTGWSNWQPPPPRYVETPVQQREEPAPPPEPPPPAAEGPSDMDRLREKTEMWRARYRPVAEQITQLEKEIPRLEADAARAGSVPFEDDNPSKNQQTRLESDFARGRLAAARRELEQARRELSDIEEAARRDGVPSGQLY
jgi:hypothetical protein